MSISKKEAMTSCGTRLKPGYRYVKGGKIVRAKSAAKTTKKKPALKAVAQSAGGKLICAKKNESTGFTEVYSAQSSNPSTACPYGGRLTTMAALEKSLQAAGMNGTKRVRPAKRKQTARKKTAKK